MAVEAREVRAGEHFIGDAARRIEQIFDYLRQDDSSLKVDGRYAEFQGKVTIRGESVDTVVRFVGKDFSEGEVSRKAAITASIKYANLDRRFVKTVIKNMADGTTILEIEDTLTFPSFYGEAPKKTIQTARLRRQDNTWKIEEVSDTVKEGREESRLTDLIPTSAIAGTALGHALEVAQATEVSLRATIADQVARERRAREEIAELLG